MNKSILVLMVICFLGGTHVFAGVRHQGADRFSCRITDEYVGPSVTSVQYSTGANENVFWLEFEASDNVQTVKFVIKYLDSKALRRKDVQKYSVPSGVGTAVGSAFAPTSEAEGAAVLKVKSALGTCTYPFTVTAPIVIEP